MKNFIKALHQRPIAYYPIYKEITGSTIAGILLSQLMYWLSKKDRIFKTDKQIMEETKLTKDELRGAKTRLKNLPFLDIYTDGYPAKTYYKIDWNAMLYFITQNGFMGGENPETRLGKSPKLDKGNSLNRGREIPQTLPIAEITYIDYNIEKEKNKKENFSSPKELPQNLNLVAYEKWLNYKGKNYKAQGKTLSANILSKHPREIQLQMVEQSICNNWAGLFEVKQPTYQNKQLLQVKQSASDSLRARLEELGHTLSDFIAWYKDPSLIPIAGLSVGYFNGRYVFEYTQPAKQEHIETEVTHELQ